MDSWFGTFMYFCHVAIVAYFLFLTNAEAREQARRRDARRRRIELLGFRPRTPPQPPEEVEFLA